MENYPTMYDDDDENDNDNRIKLNLFNNAKQSA